MLYRFMVGFKVAFSIVVASGVKSEASRSSSEILILIAQ